MNKILLVGDKFMPEMHLKQPGFTYSACGPIPKIKKELKSLCRQEIQILFIKMNLTRLVLNMYDLLESKRFSKKSTIRYSFKR